MLGKTLKSLIKSLYIVAFAVPVLLTACAGSIEPGPMPTGYKYHNTTYKAPAGAEPAFWERKGQPSAETTELAPMASGAENSAAPAGHMMAEPTEAQAWLPAARELVSRIKSRLGQPMEPTFFEGLNGKTIPGFEAALKMATAEQGWPAAVSRGSGPFHMAYSAMASDMGDSGRMMLTVRLTVSAGNFVIEESGLYAITQGSHAEAGHHPTALTPTE